MALDPLIIQEMTSIVKSVIPGWSGFSHPRFEEEEVIYKKKGIAKAQELLNQAELDRLLTFRTCFLNFHELLANSRHQALQEGPQAPAPAGSFPACFRPGMVDLPIPCNQRRSRVQGSKKGNNSILD
jgi:hypothetical protein